MSDAAMGSAMDPQHGSRLVQIPLEVLVRITYFISTTDLAHVRLSCKALEQALFNFFSHEFFRKKQFMASSESLQALIDISKHPILSSVLKHVIISSDRPGMNIFPPDEYNDARTRLALANADLMSLLATGTLRDMLAEAFANLPKLETVDIRDFNSPSRNRDGLRVPWRSYGATALASATGTPVAGYARSGHDPYITQLFSTVTAALAAAQARPKSFEVLIRGDWRLRTTWGLHDSAFYIPPRMEESVASLLQSLRSLHLSLALTNSGITKPFMYQEFLASASNLTWLRLNFSGTLRQDSQHLLTWLALKETGDPPSHIDSEPIQFRHLERLDLGGIETDAATILKLAAKFAPTLTSLSLRRVRLFDSENHLRPTKVNPWVGCLTALAKLPGIKLREVGLSILSHAFDGFQGNVLFKPEYPIKLPQDWTCSSNLVTLDKAIAEAIAVMVVDMPRDPDPEPMDGMYKHVCSPK